jgi:hypothetical protein
VVNKGLLEDAKNGVDPIKTQINFAKEFNKPCFLFCVDLTPEEIEETKKIFKEHKVVQIFTSTTKDFKSNLPHFMDEIGKWAKKDKTDKLKYIR